MASKVDIANLALNSIGETVISSLTEDTKQAQTINQVFDEVRDNVFRSHPFNSLICRASLSQEGTTPSFGYTHQYTLPTNPFCLRVLEFSTGSLTYPYDNMVSTDGQPVFVVEGRKLLTNEGTAKIKYIGQITDTTLYDSSLVSALAASLAYEICYKITGSTSLRNTLKNDYDDKLKTARYLDATEGQPQRIEASDFIESRF